MYDVKVRKGMDGKLRAENYVPIAGGRQLQVSTSKYGKKLCTVVTAVKVDGNTVTWIPFSDYNKRVTEREVRATENVIVAQQRDVLNNIEQFVKEAEAFYAAKKPGVNIIEGEFL
jgi:hypothetical protein